jgi:hypothetical protein
MIMEKQKCGRKPNTEWTKSKVFKDAKKYKSYHEWLINSYSYYYAKKNNWTKEIDKYFIKIGAGNKNPRHSKEELIQKAKKYKRWAELSKAEPNLYKAILRKKLQNIVKDNMLPPKGPMWTKEKILADAKKYRNSKEWRKNSPGAYRISNKLKCYAEASMHFKRLTKKITKDDVFKEALKYNRRVDFLTNSPSYYAKALRNKWLKKCCSHMISIKESKEFGRYYRWTEETIMKEVKKFRRWGDMLKKNQGLRDALERLGIDKKIKAQMDTSNTAAWTFEELEKISKKYKSLKTFTKHNEGALRSIYKNGWAEQLISHLRVRSKPKKWTDKDILKTIKECKTRETLRNKYIGAYNHIKKNPKKYAHLFISNIMEIELKMLHPKIKKIFNNNKKNYKYNEKLTIKNKSIFPDFTYRKNNILYLIEAKTSGCLKSETRADIDKQVKKQIKFAKKLYPKNKIIHILISEEGLIQSKFTNYNLSLKELNYFLKFNKLIKIHNSNQLTPKELCIKIRKDFMKQNQVFSSGIRQAPRLDQDSPSIGPDGETDLLN